MSECSIALEARVNDAIASPKIQELIKELKGLMGGVACGQEGGARWMKGGVLNDYLPKKTNVILVTSAVAAIAVALVGLADVRSARDAQCTGDHFLANLITQSAYCEKQAALLTTQTAWAFGKGGVAMAAISALAYGADATGGMKRKSKARKSKARKSKARKSKARKMKSTRKRR